MNSSNYTFRGKNVSIRSHWTGEYELIDNATNNIISVGDLESVLKEYDKLNH